MTFSISTTHWRRPDYSKRIMEALASQPGAKDCDFIASLDTHKHRRDIGIMIRKYRDAFRGFSCKDRMGLPSCNNNMKNALFRAFERGADFNMHVEDDVLVGKDFINFMTAQALSRNTPNVFTISAWRHKDGWLPENPEGVKNDFATGWDSHFNCWGWGTWHDRLSEILGNWTTGNDGTYSWDCWLDKVVRGDRVEIAPMISRAQNIGHLYGTHRGEEILTHWINS